LIEKIKRNWQEQREEVLKSEMDEQFKMFRLAQIDSGPEFWKKQRQRYVVNCWHQNDHESAAMWKLYLKSDEGVAVASSPEKLRDSIHDAGYLMNIGSIEYVEFDSYSFFNNIFAPVMRKRKSFAHEHELRIVAVRGKDAVMDMEPFDTKGILI